MNDSAGAFSSEGVAVAGSELFVAEVWPVFLPVVGLKDASTLYQEALVRTDLACGHKQLIARAEKTGFVSKIDCSVLSQTVDLLLHTRGISVGVNVSAVTVKNDAAGWLERISEASHVANRIVVELTESQVFDDLEKLSLFVSACRDLGVRIALDDFESGQFSDELVRRVSPDIIKLSNVWEGGSVDSRPRLSAYVDRVSNLGGSAIVVEWVDAKWKFDLLSDLPITYAQGLYVGREFSVRDLIAACGNGDASYSVAPEPLFAGLL